MNECSRRFTCFVLIILIGRISVGSESFHPLSRSIGSHSLTSSLDEYDSSFTKCEPLDTDVMKLCKGIAYNETRFPNFMKQKTLKEAAEETELYLPLVRINCSPVLKLFLCSLYAPPCVQNYSSQLRPCREMCEKVKLGCESYMKRYAFNWPDYIECWNFPSFNGAEACIADENYPIFPKSSPAKSLSPALTPFPSSLSENSADTFLSSLNQQQHELLFKSLGKSKSFNNEFSLNYK